MRAALWLFVLALICIAVAWWVSGLTGMVSATVAGTTITTSTPIAIALLAIVFVAAYVVIRVIALLLSLPRRSGRWRAARARGRGEAAVNRTLVALAANDSGAARREADRSRRLLGDTPVTLLLAAQAGTQAGRDDEATALYEMLAGRKESRLLGLRGLLRQAVAHEDWERATTLAVDAEKAHPGARWLRDERRFMALQTGRWQEALQLAGPNDKAALSLEAAGHESDASGAFTLAKQAFDSDHALPPAAILYAEKLRQTGRERQANDVLRQGWGAGPHPDIARAYVAHIEDPVGRAREMAVLVRNNPDHPESHMAVARAALDAGLVQEARRLLEAGRQAGLNERRFWTLLGEVAALEGDADGQQDAAQHMQEAEPDPVWRCEACGTQYDSWHGVCANCRNSGSIKWGRPGATSSPKPRAAGRVGFESAL